MAKREFRILKTSDRELLSRLRSLATALGHNDAEVQFLLAQGHNQPIQFPISKAEDVLESIPLLNVDAAVSHRVTLTLATRCSISILREAGFDTATVNFPDDYALAADLILETQKVLQPYELTENIDRLLGAELSEFYHRREATLLKLEGLSQRLIEDNETYRRRLDAQHEDIKQKFQQNLEDEQKRLESGYSVMYEELETKRTNLENRAKDLDDRTSRHVRREIRHDLKKALEERSVKFGLTRETTRKRIPIHLLFSVLIVVIGVVFVDSFLSLASGGLSSDPWYPLIRLSMSLIGLAAALVFYIRWNDNWFRQHADEEFRLKRLELDIDRASWVVEMALEWQEEKGSVIPQELIDRLTSNLFIDQDRRAPPKHPSEDLASAIVAASAGLTLRIPGFGELTLDRRGVKRFTEAVEKASETREGRS